MNDHSKQFFFPCQQPITYTHTNKDKGEFRDGIFVCLLYLLYFVVVRNIPCYLSPRFSFVGEVQKKEEARRLYSNLGKALLLSLYKSSHGTSLCGGKQTFTGYSLRRHENCVESTLFGGREKKKFFLILSFFSFFPFLSNSCFALENTQS